MNALEMAKKMETDAIRFYQEAANKTSYPAASRMFLSIIEDEKGHLEMIDQIIKDLDIKPQDVSPMTKVKTVFAEMKEEMMKKVEATPDDLMALKVAMEMEYEGAEFYKKSLAEAKTEKEKKLFKRLIEEEKQHYKIFFNSHQFLSDTGSWFMWQEHAIVER